MDPEKSRLKDKNFFLNSFFPFLFLALSFCLFSCNVAIENPEKRDPIYLDLLKEKKKYEDLRKELKHQLAINIKKKSRMQNRTLEIKLNQSSIRKLNTKIKKYNQKILYYKIKAKKRLQYVRKSYAIALKNKKKWPDPKEYEFYLISKKLKNAPRKWNRRTAAFKKNSETDENSLDAEGKTSSEGKKSSGSKSKH